MLLVTALLLTAACGNENEDRSAGVRKNDSMTVSSGRAAISGEPRDPEERAARGAMEGLYASLGRKTVNAAKFCNFLSAESIRQTVQYAKRASGVKKKWSCRSSVAFMAERSKDLGAYGESKDVMVIGVNVEGGHATATIQEGNNPITAVPMIKENGEWKLGGSRVNASR
jgi:hypothetical protein